MNHLELNKEDNGVVIVTDITTEKNSKGELEKLKARLQEAQEFAHVGYWEYDAIIESNYWSDEMYCILGYEPQEFMPTFNSFTKMVHSEDLPLISNAMKEPTYSKTSEFNYRIIKKDGSIIWLYEKVKFERDSAGNLSRMYGIVQEITERKISEDKLRESEQRYKGLTENVPVGILSYDSNGTITFINPKALEILNSPSEEATKKINLFTFPLLIEYGISEVFKQCIEIGDLISAEKRYVSRWGREAIARLQVAPVKNQNGEILSAIAIMEDFTERMNLELELKIAKEQAELSTKAKSQFLANMSHEIRTPMNGIIGMTDLLLYSDLSKEQRSMVDIVKSSSASLLLIIDDILELSKIEAGKIELKPNCLDLYAFINKLINVFDHLLISKNLEFKTNIAKHVPREIFVDELRLMQIISNLISNAIKFTDSGSIELSVKKVKSINDKVEILFSISDTGIGIKEQDIPRLFNYFTQLDDSKTKRFQGTGLGLSISKNLVELMGGEIYVESEYGKGSTFYFTCWVDEVNQGNNNSNIENKQLSNNPLHNLSLLLVEDDLVSQMIIIRLGKMKGWNITATTNGPEALSILDSQCFDVILMDVNMAEMSGYEVTRAIRTKESLSGKQEHTPIIATTAYAMNRDKEAALRAGMDAYISKPLDLSELVKLIETWTKK